MRHTHAVWLLESGARMKFIQERLGHKLMQTIADIYSHISGKIEDDYLKNLQTTHKSLHNNK
ncbi:tyrosine-type recombinase/integrase [Amphibacillus marinus]|uniref:tyrosine-type recombinase/integrase n=1 Tax=Amphibacillus marinus TaxID=872970 RepID=UPI000B82BF63